MVIINKNGIFQTWILPFLKRVRGIFWKFEYGYYLINQIYKNLSHLVRDHLGFYFFTVLLYINKNCARFRGLEVQALEFYDS